MARRPLFEKILIANRGEIAVRVMRTARKMGIKCVAVYSDADKHAYHKRYADEAVYIGEAEAAKSYLDIEKVISVARETGAQAIHPGYGFLSENATFARACKDAGIVFIGPSAEAIEAMGLKDHAKDLMIKANVPVVPGYQGEKQDVAFLKSEADKIGYPVLIKAVAGGGGKGMRLVESAEDFEDALNSCKREAQSSFGNDHVLIEKYITKPRHIEVQVFGDDHGDAVYLFERDCSLQRRHQKVVEEAPAPNMPEDVRKAMGEAAVNAAKAISYSGAGTIEFIVDASGVQLTKDSFYFMEMNTRLQVEHPVTEMITGQDLVEWQIRVAAGQNLPLKQSNLSINGHAMEVRIYAEDAANQFLPQTGTVSFMRHGFKTARLDTAIEQGDEISIFYDPMIAKLITHGADREEAIKGMVSALDQFAIGGVTTNQEFLSNIMRHDAFFEADLDTGFIERHKEELLPENYSLPSASDVAVLISHLMYRHQNQDDPWSANRYWRGCGVPVIRHLKFTDRQGANYDLEVTLGESAFSFNWDGEVKTFNPVCSFGKVFNDEGSVSIFKRGRVVPLALYDASKEQSDSAGQGQVVAPMPGRIISLIAKAGEKIEKGQAILVMEAMKMEVTIKADVTGLLENLDVAAGDQVKDGAVLASIVADGES